jgi:hypothetical protein
VKVLVQLELFVLNPKLGVEIVEPVVADSSKLVRVAVAKKLEYDEFQAEIEARTLDGTGAMVAWAEEQPEEAMDSLQRSRLKSVRLSAS